MKKLNIYAITLYILLILESCKTTKIPVSPGPTNVVKINLSSNSKIDYGSLKNGYARSNDIFVVQVTGYNPLKYRIGATTTGLVTFQNNASPIIAYTTVTPPTATTPTAPGLAPASKRTLLDAEKKKLQAIINKITSATPKINSATKAISEFQNVLADYQNTIEVVWKKLDNLNSAVVKSEQQFVFNRLGNIINDYFSGGTNNPYQPTLGIAPNCTINFYMVTDFPGKVNNDLTNQISNYKIALNQLNLFESEHGADIKFYAQQAGISNYDAFKKDFAASLAAIENYQLDFTTLQQPKLSQFASSISNVATLQYSSVLGPFTLLQNDEITIKLSKTDLITNTDALSNFPGIVVKRKGGAKIDFSAGIFFSTLFDKSYVTSQITRITQDSVVESGTVTLKSNQTMFSTIKHRGGSNFSYGPMAFIHFHSMTAGPLNYGAFIGTGFMFKDNTKPVLAAGGNLMIANFQRVILGIGAALGSVNRLSSKYQENELYREAITDVPTESHLNLKGMFSISWNLSK